MAIVYYSATTGRVRRVISNSAGESRSDLALARVHKREHGEQILRVADPVDLSNIQNVVSQESGLVPENDRYVGVSLEDGVVGPCILADPVCGDSIAGYTLVAHADARKGWRQIRNGSFQRSLPEIVKDIAGQTHLVSRLARAPGASAAARAAAQAALAAFQAEKTAREAPL